MRSFLEFFAGGGLARVGLGDRWQCLWANDIDDKKCTTYRKNFDGAPMLVEGDIHSITARDIPGGALMAWASFPCQDLSLAGKGAGLDADRSGCFWPFWKIVVGMKRSGRRIPIVVLENVPGLLTASGGKDFSALCAALNAGGYRFGAVLMDAARFLPQSRPRLFVVAVDRMCRLPKSVVRKGPDDAWHKDGVTRGFDRLSESVRENWVWWNLPQPLPNLQRLDELIETPATGVRWHSPTETERLLDMMSPSHLAKVLEIQLSGKRAVGAVYKRTRPDPQGGSLRRQRAEVRFDGKAGCLRTPMGGSSRQILLFVAEGTVRSRLISPREAARLMGLPENYRLPDGYNEACHLLGDAVVVPVVSWLERYLLHPIAASVEEGMNRAQRKAAHHAMSRV
jgi:DNA (cytosine-5)-methyltransferase 1